MLKLLINNGKLRSLYSVSHNVFQNFYFTKFFIWCKFTETSTVPATAGETSRKRTADVEPTADVPSASRRRRNANTDASSYIRPAFPSCCVNGSLFYSIICLLS